VTSAELANHMRAAGISELREDLGPGGIAEYVTRAADNLDEAMLQLIMSGDHYAPVAGLVHQIRRLQESRLAVARPEEAIMPLLTWLASPEPNIMAMATEVACEIGEMMIANSKSVAYKYLAINNASFTDEKTSAIADYLNEKADESDGLTIMKLYLPATVMPHQMLFLPAAQYHNRIIAVCQVMTPKMITALNMEGQVAMYWKAYCASGDMFKHDEAMEPVGMKDTKKLAAVMQDNKTKVRWFTGKSEEIVALRRIAANSLIYTGRLAMPVDSLMLEPEAPLKVYKSRIMPSFNKLFVGQGKPYPSEGARTEEVIKPGLIM